MGTSGSIARISLHTSNPFFSGIMTSRTTSDGFSLLKSSKACVPVFAGNAT